MRKSPVSAYFCRKLPSLNVTLNWVCLADHCPPSLRPELCWERCLTQPCPAQPSIAVSLPQGCPQPHPHHPGESQRPLQRHTFARPAPHTLLLLGSALHG